MCGASDSVKHADGGHEERGGLLHDQQDGAGVAGVEGDPDLSLHLELDAIRR